VHMSMLKAEQQAGNEAGASEQPCLAPKHFPPLQKSSQYCHLYPAGAMQACMKVCRHARIETDTVSPQNCIRSFSFVGHIEQPLSSFLLLLLLVSYTRASSCLN